MNQGYLKLFLTPNYKSKMEVKQREDVRKKTGRGGGSIKGVEGGRELRTFQTLIEETSLSLSHCQPA